MMDEGELEEKTEGGNTEGCTEGETAVTLGEN